MIVYGEVAITTCTSWWLKGRLRQTPVFFCEREKRNLDTIFRCFAVRRYTSGSLRRLHRRLSIFRRQQAETEAEKNPRFPGVILRNYRPRSSGWIHRWSKGTVLPSNFFSIRKKSCWLVSRIWYNLNVTDLIIKRFLSATNIVRF